ncbi:MAG: polymerase sigma-70 factor, subfamily, partial [Pseudonocardiales bacterium]|nr:polymerase sigma-70 factor, subfamily [Pseudonocardiales bacterium]
MPSAARPFAGSRDPVFGLRTLAELINEARAAMGTRPAFALAGAGLPGGLLMASEATIPGTRPGRGRAHAATGRSASGGAAPQAPDPAVVEDEHVETWRLVTLAQAGDGEAFGQLYDRYVDIVFRFVYYRVNDRGMAEDFTSETFLRALRRISTITYQGRDIGAWFITIA